MTSHPQFPTSHQQLEELSTHLQQSCPKQTGTLIMDHSGLVLTSSGDVKESAERIARLVLTLMQDSNGVFAQSTHQSRKAKEELARLTIAFKTYQYAITLTHDMVICVKSNID